MTVNYPLPTHEEKIDLLALWRVVRSYAFFIGLTTAVCVVVAGILAYTAAPVYHAEVTVTEASNDNLTGAAANLTNQLGGIASLVGVNLGAGGGKSNEVQGILKSRKLVEEFVTRYGLLPKLYPEAKQPPTRWLAVRHFQNDVLSIREDKRTGLTFVAINWTDPAIAARWANDLVALANEIIRTNAMNEAKASIDYLNGQIARTSVVEIQRVMYGLIENETKTLMLANAKSDYAFTVIDPAVPPEVRSGPHRLLMLLLGLTLGLVVATLAALAHSAWTRTRDSEAGRA